MPTRTLHPQTYCVASGILASIIGTTAALSATHALTWEPALPTLDLMYAMSGVLAVCSVLCWRHARTRDQVAALASRLANMQESIDALRQGQAVDSDSLATKIADQVEQRVKVAADRQWAAGYLNGTGLTNLASVTRIPQSRHPAG